MSVEGRVPLAESVREGVGMSFAESLGEEVRMPFAEWERECRGGVMLPESEREWKGGVLLPESEREGLGGTESVVGTGDAVGVSNSAAVL
jgi:hypothetical protein